MTKKEIEERLEDMNRRYFFLQMKDRWDYKDYALDTKWRNEIRVLEKMLKEVTE